MENQIFILLAPHYNPASNGIMIFYQLGEQLRQLGHSAYYVPLNKQDFLLHLHLYPKDTLAQFIREYGDVPANSIAILPDITPSDILDELPSLRRVWFLANKPLILTGLPVNYRPKDAVIAYSGCISKFYFNAFFNRKFEDFNPLCESHQQECQSKHALILIYFGKSRSNVITRSMLNLIKKRNARVISINRHFPSSREQLYKLLRSAKLLISYDPFTNLNYESTLCGTPCFIADNYMGVNYSDYNIPLPGIFEDESLLDSYYSNGMGKVMLDKVWSTYRVSTQDHLKTTSNLVTYLTGWFSLVDDAEKNPQMLSLLEIHNNLRLENDLLYYKTLGSKPADPKLHNLILPEGIGDWIYHRFERYRWFLYRDFYKYIVRQRPDKLAKNLFFYKKNRAARLQSRCLRQLKDLNIE